MDHATILFTLTIIIGLYMLWNIGANDVANAIGTSIGSGAITLKKALIIAAIFEFAGAFLLGSNVSETIQSGIIDPQQFDPPLILIGMLSSLLATAIWLQIATHLRWPVSTTHAIVGAVLGFGLLIGGVEAIHWSAIGKIAISWIASPGISAIMAFFLFSFLQKKILFSFSPLNQAKKIAPFLVLGILFVFTLATFLNGIENLHLEISLPLVFLLSILTGCIGFLICYFAVSRIHKTSLIDPKIATKKQAELYSLAKIEKHLRRLKLYAKDNNQKHIDHLLSSTAQLSNEVHNTEIAKEHIHQEYLMVEKIFAFLQILSACFVAFGHGANDVANAIGPVSAIIELLHNPFVSLATSVISPWLLLFGGFGIVLGLATYGWRVIETIGKNITHLTPTRGFSAEFAAATTIVVASKLGLPISTTHSIVGAVLGIGLARGLSALNFRLIRGIFLSWVITLPASAISATIIFLFLKFLFL